MALRTRRTNTEISTFIQAWLDAATTREVASLLARRRKEWPYSIAVPSLTQYACQLRSAGVELPYMEGKGQAIDATLFNALINAR